MTNQNPEQVARDNIDKQLNACGWVIQGIKQVNLNAGIGVAVKENRVPFMVFMDEFHNFTTLSLVNMLSELRKFKEGLVLAHQYMHQLDEDFRQAVLENIGTIISFRIGTENAKHMVEEMFPEFDV